MLCVYRAPNTWENRGEQCCWSTWQEQRGLLSVWAPKAVIHEQWCHTGIGLCFPSLWQMWTASYSGLQCSWDNLHKLICFMENYRLINENDWKWFRFFEFTKLYRIPVLSFDNFHESPAWFRQRYCPADGFSVYLTFVSLHPDEWLLPQFF